MIAARTLAVLALAFSFANGASRVSLQAATGGAASPPLSASAVTVSINEVETSGGVPGDWVELYNTGASVVDLSGFVFRDNDDTHTYTIPSGAMIAPGSYYLLEEAAFGFGLGGGDSARLFDTFGTIVDSYTWTTAANTTYGRCPNGSGAFVTTVSSTKGAANNCVVPVTINEIESSGGTPGDWVELYNPDASSADISGFVFRDNDDTHTYTIPVGTTIAPGGYYLLEEAAFGFGLGGGDSARLFDPLGAIVDTYAWTTAAATTYGRCPNGTGAFTTTVSSTKGAANSCATPAAVYINEVESNGGVPGDWVELYNPGGSAADISGFVFRDNDDTHTYTIPIGSTIAPGGYYLLEEAAFTFGLGSADSARIFDPLGTLADTYTWTAHAATTYGRCPNGTGAFITNVASTKGAANNCVAAVTVNINEVESNGGTPGDWVELYNAGASLADISGFVFRDSDDTHTYTIPAGTTIAAGGYYLLEEAAFNFGLGSADSARLFDPAGALADSYAWASHAVTTYGRCPNGTGAFSTTTASTKGAANACAVSSVTDVHINEIESSGGVPGDWVELINTGASPADISGWRVLDSDDTHTPLTLPANTTIAAGGYLMVEEAALGFGLGGSDSVRLYDANGALFETYSWATAAATTYGRCPNGTGAFTTTTSVTKGAANDCGSPVKVNEVESSGGVPGDWVELYNPGGSSVDLAGYVFRDSDDTHSYTIPSGSTITADGYYLLEESAFGFGLGGADSARLFDPGGTLIDSYTWATAAATTYGRCPNGIGAFTTTTASTKGAANACPGAISALPWPGDPDVLTVDGLNVFGGNISGLVYEAASATTPAVLWAVRNNPGALFRLIFDGTVWTPDPANGWSAGKTLLYPGGTGSPDSEGVTFTGSGPAGGMYVATERDNNNGGTISRNSILRFDVTAAGATLTATHEWNLSADLPAVGSNLGAEAITWIPDTYLVSHGFLDESKGHVYNPAEYANHGTGLFFVGLEANGIVYAYALDSAGVGFARIATITTGLVGVMDLQFDPDLNGVWAICDDGCLGRSTILRIATATGKFVATDLFDRPAGMPNLNNEGFAIAPQTECAGNRRSAFWSDDSETGGHAIRRGNLICDSTPPLVSQLPNLTIEAVLGGTVVTYAAPTWTDNVDGTGVATCAPASASVFPLGVTTVVCTAADAAGNIGMSSFTVTVQDTIAPQVTPPADQQVIQNIPAGAVVNYPPPTIVETGSGLASSGCLPASGSVFPLGTSVVTCSAADVAGNVGSGTFSVTITAAPNASPVCSAAGPMLSLPIFPVDHGMRGVSIGGVVDPDGDPVTLRITGICQDEAPNAENVPAWAVDGAGINSSSAAVRAERGGTRLTPGNGRVYHIFFSADDGKGGVCSNEVKVGVPLTSGGAAGDGGALFDSVTGGGCVAPAAP